jgi:hypothetical protein
LSKEFARVLGPGQIVTSLEHLAQCRGVQVTTMWSGPNTRAAILTNKFINKSYYFLTVLNLIQHLIFYSADNALGHFTTIVNTI